MDRLKIIILLLASLIISSCSTSLKNIEYLNDSNKHTAHVKDANPYKLRGGDNLFIKITSDNKGLSELFNSSITFNTTNSASLDLISYTISEEGIIIIPLIGDIKVIDLTLDQAKIIISKKVNNILSNPSIMVKLVNIYKNRVGGLDKEHRHPLTAKGFSCIVVFI